MTQKTFLTFSHTYAKGCIDQEGFKNVFFVQLDATDPASIASVKEMIEKNDGGLDVLVKNAATIGITAMPQSSPDVDLATVRATPETNSFGLIQTMTASIPLIRKSPQAVILNVSSELGSNAPQSLPGSGFHYFAYNTSKAAVNSYTIVLAKGLEVEDIKVNAVTPGFTSTRLSDDAASGKPAVDGARSLLS